MLHTVASNCLKQSLHLGRRWMIPCPLTRNFDTSNDDSISNKGTSFVSKNIGFNNKESKVKDNHTIPDPSEINESIKKRFTASDISGMTAREIVMMPFSYHTEGYTTKQDTQIVGKAYQSWMGLSKDHSHLVNETAFWLQEATIAHDDILDHSLFRRGKPAAPRVFGVELSSGAEHVAGLAGIEYILDNFPDDLKLAAIKIYTDEYIHTTVSIALDTFYRDHFICPSEKQYISHYLLKAEAWSRLNTRLSLLFADEKTKSLEKDFVLFSETIGQWFQLRDDYANLRSPKYAEQRTAAFDITEGKFTFPIVHYVHNHPEDTRVLDILRMRTTDDNLKREVIKILEESGSIAYLQETLDKFENRLHQIIDSIDDKLGDRKRGEYMRKLVSSHSWRTINTVLEKDDTSWGY